MISLLAQFTPVDLYIASQFYVPEQHNWIAAQSWWANQLIHDWGRNLIALIFLASASLFLLSFVLRKKLHRLRVSAAYLALSIALTTSLVGLGKQFSNVDCPWDLQLFNGLRPYIHLFSDKPDTLERGHCFPGGHSSGAFSLFALFFIFLKYRRRFAYLVLTGVVLLGLSYALAQWARGAHFPSHDLWSAAIGWYISLGLYLLMLHHSAPARIAASTQTGSTN